MLIIADTVKVSVHLSLHLSCFAQRCSSVFNYKPAYQLKRLDAIYSALGEPKQKNCPGKNKTFGQHRDVEENGSLII